MSDEIPWNRKPLVVEYLPLGADGSIWQHGGFEFRKLVDAMKHARGTFVRWRITEGVGGEVCCASDDFEVRP
jgi:hypothetical protein